MTAEARRAEAAKAGIACEHRIARHADFIQTAFVIGDRRHFNSTHVEKGMNERVSRQFVDVTLQQLAEEVCNGSLLLRWN